MKQNEYKMVGNRTSKPGRSFGVITKYWGHPSRDAARTTCRIQRKYHKIITKIRRKSDENQAKIKRNRRISMSILDLIGRSLVILTCSKIFRSFRASIPWLISSTTRNGKSVSSCSKQKQYNHFSTKYNHFQHKIHHFHYKSTIFRVETIIFSVQSIHEMMCLYKKSHLQWQQVEHCRNGFLAAGMGVLIQWTKLLLLLETNLDIDRKIFIIEAGGLREHLVLLEKSTFLVKIQHFSVEIHSCSVENLMISQAIRTFGCRSLTSRSPTSPQKPISAMAA